MGTRGNPERRRDDHQDGEESAEHAWQSRENVALGLAILVVLVPGALVGVFTVPVAVLSHELSELAVIGNGLRLARR